VQEDTDWSDNVYSNGHNLNDSASSIFNNGTRTRQIYRDKSFGGHTLCLAADTGVTDLNHVQWTEITTLDNWVYAANFDMNDRASSHYTNKDATEHLRCDWIAKSDQRMPDADEIPPIVLPPVIVHPPAP
jgi:hypothetical protein